MKKISLLLTLLYSINGYTQRYLTDDYPVLDSIIGGTYGTAIDYQSNIQSLLFDFYEPKNDALVKRPLIIYIHGGGFTSGSRSYPSIKLLCKKLATKGYAVATVDYRLDPNFNLYNSTSNRRAMTDAMHDAKQAIRYFRANASTYQLDPDLIFIGGESAGAITSMMASFVDKQSEMSIYPMANPNNPIGSTANAQVSNTVKGTLCLCGTILDTLAMETPTDPTILWTHGTQDTFIPISFAYNVVLRANHIGLPIETKVYAGATHCPWYYGNPNWSNYLDSTITDITNFMYPQVSIIAGVSKGAPPLDLSIYPNPFQDRLSVRLNNPNESNYEITINLFSSLGETVLKKVIEQNDNGFELNLENLNGGIYYLLIDSRGRRGIRKIVKSR